MLKAFNKFTKVFSNIKNSLLNFLSLAVILLNVF